jgi:hypothetical protein
MIVGAVALVVAGAAGGFKARGTAAGAGGGGDGAALRPLSESEWPPAVLSGDRSSSSGSNPGAWPPPTPSASPLSKQQPPQGRVPTKAPSLAPADGGSSSNSTSGEAAKAPPETMLELLVALQQEELERDKKYITSDYFGREIPKENKPGQFAHVTGEIWMSGRLGRGLG